MIDCCSRFSSYATPQPIELPKVSQGIPGRQSPRPPALRWRLPVAREITVDHMRKSVNDLVREAKARIEELHRATPRRNCRRIVHCHRYPRLHASALRKALFPGTLEPTECSNFGSTRTVRITESSSSSTVDTCCTAPAGSGRHLPQRWVTSVTPTWRTSRLATGLMLVETLKTSAQIRNG